MAPHVLPPFLPGADGSDPLFTVITIFVIALLIGAGGLYFTLHALPEKMGHSANSTQLQLISILAILALFTHNNLFWVIALVIAAVRLPDYLTPLTSIAESLAKTKNRER
jgi:hypothetical protein